MIQLIIAMLSVDSGAAKLITMLLFGTAVAASMLLIMAYDQSFGSGGVPGTAVGARSDARLRMDVPRKR